MEKLTHSELLEAISHFEIDGNVINIEENHNGHINDTFVVTAETKPLLLKFLALPDVLLANFKEI